MGWAVALTGFESPVPCFLSSIQHRRREYCLGNGEVAVGSIRSGEVILAIEEAQAAFGRIRGGVDDVFQRRCRDRGCVRLP